MKTGKNIGQFGGRVHKTYVLKLRNNDGTQNGVPQTLGKCLISFVLSITQFYGNITEHKMVFRKSLFLVLRDSSVIVP